MKTKKGITRILAFMLALLMVISTVEMTAFTSFAAERDEFETSEEVSEELTEDVSEEVSGEPSEEASEEVSEEVTEEASEEVSEEPSEEVSEAYAEENIVAATKETCWIEQNAKKTFFSNIRKNSKTTNSAKHSMITNVIDTRDKRN